MTQINFNSNNIGLLISKFRNDKNITQDALSESCGIHRTTLSDIERGISSPTIDVIQKICNTLNIDLLQFLGSAFDRKSFKIYQPRNGNLGDKIIENLKSNNYTRLNIAVAYAKLSGVNRLKPSLLEFKSLGGEINCFVGIDQYNTTYEALNELFDLCDNLYIIHNQNPSHTYHPKVYMFDKSTSNSNNAWLATGSNNLTAGGLFINYESCSVDLLDLNNLCDKSNYDDTLDFFKSYEDEQCPISNLVKEKDFIDKLLNNKYIIKERQSRIFKKRSPSEESNSSTNLETLFGKETFNAPPLDSSINRNKNRKNKNTSIIDTTSDSVLLSNDFNDLLNTTSDILEDLKSPEIKESFWFQMGKGTGGSCNILDLSSSAKLLSGNIKNTKYYDESTSKMLGGISFFDINPSSHEITKDITISFNGNEYNPITILFNDKGENPNYSWRVQLKGVSSTDNNALSRYGKKYFKKNILVFHKIASDYYILDIIPGSKSELDSLKNNSEFVASNGYRTTNRLFGKLK